MDKPRDLDALDRVVAILDVLTEPERVRIVRFLYERYCHK